MSLYRVCDLYARYPHEPLRSWLSMRTIFEGLHIAEIHEIAWEIDHLSIPRLVIRGPFVRHPNAAFYNDIQACMWLVAPSSLRNFLRSAHA